MAPRIEIIDNEDGTWTAEYAEDEDFIASVTDPGLFTLNKATVVSLGPDTVQISSTIESRRLQLQALLINILGSANVYFQPPANIHLLYPCIVYERSNINIGYANNAPYRHMKRYQVTVIDKDPDSIIPDKVAMLPLCSYDRFFAVDNLNHDVFTLFF